MRIGTFAIVFAGCGAIISNAHSHGALTHPGICLTFGLVVAAMIFALGPISAAHFNPAVTLGFAVARRFPWKHVPAYKILFVCIHNSARSQMAEAFVNLLGSDRFKAGSAGLEPGTLNPLVVEVLREKGVDISGKPTRGVQDVIASGEEFDAVVAVCDEASAERCPMFPGGGRRRHWGFTDPSRFDGSRDQKLQGTREVRDHIEARVREFLASSESF